MRALSHLVGATLSWCKGYRSFKRCQQQTGQRSGFGNEVLQTLEQSHSVPTMHMTCSEALQLAGLAPFSHLCLAPGSCSHKVPAPQPARPSPGWSCYARISGPPPGSWCGRLNHHAHDLLASPSLGRYHCLLQSLPHTTTTQAFPTRLLRTSRQGPHPVGLAAPSSSCSAERPQFRPATRKLAGDRPCT